MGIRNGCGSQNSPSFIPPLPAAPARQRGLHPFWIPTGYFRSAPAVIRIFTTDGRFDCVHHRVRISRGWPILNGIDQAGRGGLLETGVWPPHPFRIPTGYFLSAPSFTGSIIVDTSFDCVHLRFIISQELVYWANLKWNESGGAGRAARNRVLTTAAVQYTHWLPPERSIVQWNYYGGQ